MAKLSDAKAIAGIFSDLKAINTSINKYGDLKIFTGNDGEIRILLGDFPFSILVAKINFQNDLTNWLKDKKVLFPIEDFKKVVKCLKKNQREIEYEDDYFKFGMVDADGNDSSVVIKAIEILPGETRLEKVDLVESTLGEITKIPSDEFTSSVVFSFYENHKTDSQGIKVLEIPVKNIDSLLKDFGEAEIRYSPLDETTKTRFVSVASQNDKLSMVEYFATV